MLTTRCPHCSTTFRIRPEQLSVRGGRVRCGTCHQAFSALSSLEELPDDEPQIETETEQPSAASPVVPVAFSLVESSNKPETQKPEPLPVEPVSSAPVSSVVTPLLPPNPVPPIRSAEPYVAPKPVAEVPIAAAFVARESVSATAMAVQPEDERVVIKLERESAQPELPDAPLVSRDQLDDLSGGLDLTWAAIDEPDDFEPAILQPSPDQVEGIASERFTLPGDVEEPFIGKPEVRADAFVAIDPSDLDFIEPEAIGGVGGIVDTASMGVEQPGVADAAPVVQATADPAKETQQPYRSKIAEELGLAPYDPEQDQASGFTVLLEDPVSVGHDAPVAAHVSSLTNEIDDEVPHGVKVQPKKASAVPWIAGSVLLGALALTQAAYVFRTELSRSVPAFRPVVENFCKQVGCSVPYPKESDLIQVENTSLTPDPAHEGKFRLTVNLHNKAGFAQTWPHLELTLTDRFDIAIARRVLKPTEWLPEANAKQPAFVGRDDVTANVTVQVDGLPAAGYRLYAFYP